MSLGRSARVCGFAATLLAACAVVAGVALAPAAGAAPRIAFEKKGDIWTVTPSGSGLRHLTSSSSFDWSPAWSPDRKKLAFLRRSAEWEGKTRVCMVSASGRSVRVLRTTSRSTTGLAFSPDGKKLAFTDAYGVAGDPYTHNSITIFDLKTRKADVVIRHTGGLDTVWSLSWSPDGKTILVGQSGMDSEGGQTWLLDVASRHLNGLGIADAVWASWSPDGDSVVVSTETQERTSILLARPDGQILATLIEGSSWSPDPAAPPVGRACFSPAGGQIVYTVRSARSGATSLWLMGSGGGGKHRLTAGDWAAWR